MHIAVVGGVVGVTTAYELTSGFVEMADFNRDIPEARLATIRKSVESRFPGSADLIAQVIDGEPTSINLDPFRPGRFQE